MAVTHALLGSCVGMARGMSLCLALIVVGTLGLTHPRIASAHHRGLAHHRILLPHDRGAGLRGARSDTDLPRRSLRRRLLDKLPRLLRRLPPRSTVSGAVVPERFSRSAKPPALSAIVGVDVTLSSEVFEAISQLEPSALGHVGGRVAFKVGDDTTWFVVDGARQRCERSSDEASFEASVRYASERVFVAVMEDALLPSAAVALGRLRDAKRRLSVSSEVSSRVSLSLFRFSRARAPTGVRGSLSLASASEPLFAEAERRMRATLEDGCSDARVAAAEASAAASAAAAAALRLESARARSSLSPVAALSARHVGTEQQLGAALLALGSALYVGYTALVLQAAPEADVTASCEYLLSAALWLAGSAALTIASYPERVVALASCAERDAKDGLSRLHVQSPLTTLFADSALLLGAWGLGAGAPAFLAGAATQTLNHPDDLIPK